MNKTLFGITDLIITKTAMTESLQKRLLKTAVKTMQWYRETNALLFRDKETE